MVKFLIFSFVVIPVCLSKSSQQNYFDKPAVEMHLKYRFDLTPDDLKKECNVDFEKEWQKIGAPLEKFDDIYSGFLGGGLDFPDEQKEAEWKKQFLHKCHNSKPFKKAAKHVIKTALPCAEKDSLDKHYKNAKPYLC
ncbi:uncharacterized protein LOC117169940 [Belonocnema kinseyi]|uniref:uncharacterized protein LOC117169940 n=1 Tax=Belonocnema kinseyi TaxID=2817044 RepID=UPI00143D932B|nr:uncharacterized protein LOC117169940 [Belonocnema kinseyi]